MEKSNAEKMENFLFSIPEVSVDIRFILQMFGSAHDKAEDHVKD